MRLWPRSAMPALLLVLGAAATPAGAGEIFLCADGRQIVVDRRDRARSYATACAKAWFSERGDPVAAAAADKRAGVESGIVFTRAGRRHGGQ